MIDIHIKCNFPTFSNVLLHTLYIYLQLAFISKINTDILNINPTYAHKVLFWKYTISWLWTSFAHKVKNFWYENVKIRLRFLSWKENSRKYFIRFLSAEIAPRQFQHFYDTIYGRTFLWFLSFSNVSFAFWALSSTKIKNVHFLVSIQTSN